MRKIISKKIEDKKNQKKQLLVGALLILIMALSTIGYSLKNGQKEDTKELMYNNIKFTQINNLWNAKIGNYQFYFSYNPTEVEEVNSTLNFLNNYNNAPLYIYSENSDVTMEIYRNLVYYNGIVERMQEACLEGESCAEGVPIKNCTNNFIIIKKSITKEIRQEENCVFISGNDEELVKMSDGFLFKIMGIQ